MEDVSTKSNEFFYPNKKQLLPLIEKYGINPNKSKRFQRIVTAFIDSPTYLPWAIKCVYTKICSYQKMEKIAEWTKNNQHLISSLTKQNIISYKTESDINNLVDEMKVIGFYQPCKEVFLKFNTTQRKMLLDRYTLLFFIYQFKSGNVGDLKNMSKVCTKFLTLSATKQNTFIRKASTLDDSACEIWESLDEFTLMPYMGWSLPEVKDFINGFCSHSKIISEGDNCCVIEVGSFEDSKLLGKDTPWCICKKDGEHHWNSYVKKHNGVAKQYFFFDFSLDKEKDANACIGFTIHGKQIINDAHNKIGSGENIVPPSYKIIENKNNKYYFDEAIEGKGLDYNTWASFDKNDILSSLNIIYGNDLIWKNGIVYKLNDKVLNIRKCDFMEFLYEKNNIFLCKVNNISTFKSKFPWIRNRTFDSNFEESKPTTYVVFDMNKDITHIDSIISWDVLINDYNSYSLYGYNSQNYFVNIKKYAKSHNIDEKYFIPNVKISDSMLFHKSLVEGDYDTVWKLLKTSKDLDVNLSFNERNPIFMLAIEIPNFELFKAVFEHPSFKVEKLSDYGETILAEVIYAWSFYEDEAYLKQVIDYILSKDIDFNIKTATNDTMLLLASQDNTTAWIVEELLKKPNIDMTTVNVLGEDSLKAAVVTYQAYDCAKLLLDAGAKPMDIETEIAIKENINAELVNVNKINQ